MFSRDIPQDEPWLMPCPHVFVGPDPPEDDAAWVTENDLPDIGRALIFTQDNGAQWHALDMAATWNGKRADRKVTTYRQVRRGIGAASCALADVNRVKRAFAKGVLDFDNDPRDYRGYLAEYPRRWPYRSRGDDGVTFAFKSAGIDFDYMTLRQVRGGEWERDFSLIGRSPNLLMPSTDLVEAGDLQWDGKGSWFDICGEIQVLDPLWWSDKGPGLIVRLDYLDRFLEESGKGLAILGFQMKFVAGMSTSPGRLMQHTLFIRSRGLTKLIETKVTRD
jgi:hypothetical protein